MPELPRPTTIAQVLAALDEIIDGAVVGNDSSGIFAYVYRRTTQAIQEGIDSGRFSDPGRMEAFDVLFANLYLDSYRTFVQGQPTNRVWATALNRNGDRLTILQHILLGMNAHINYDLAIAAAQISEGQSMAALEADYMRVNDILFSIVDEMQERLSRVSPMIFLIDRFGKSSDEGVIDFSMRRARDASWANANVLWGLGADKDEHLKGMEEVVVRLARHLVAPRTWTARSLLRTVRLFEQKRVDRIISGLRA